MELIDTHCHIQSIGLKQGERTTRELWANIKDITADRVVAEAAAGGVTRLVCVGCDLEDSQLAVDFVQKRHDCWASIGLHPHEAGHYAGKPEKLEEFAGLVSRPKVVAIGECGLDFYYSHSSNSDQIDVLKFQIELALKHKLPIIFHVREALTEFWPIFDAYLGIRGVLHSFTDSAANLVKALERNLYIGVNGIATFAKDQDLVAVYRSVPLNSLLLETDAPFLTPAPYRGSINEPKRLGATADFLAQLHGEKPEEIARITTSNARKLFGI